MEITKEIAPIIDLDVKQFKDYNELVDALEKKMSDTLPSVQLPLAHTITPGLYTREMFAPKGSLIVSKIHVTDHQFIVSQGRLLVFDEYTNQWSEIKAPFRGITRKGTRRIGYVLEDIVWTTMHATSLVEDKEYTQEEFVELISKIEDDIIEKRDNKLLNTKRK